MLEVLSIYASVHQSISPFHLRPAPPPPPPPRTDPRALTFFCLKWQIPRGRRLLSYPIPRGGDERRGQMPRPPSTLQHFPLIVQSSTCSALFSTLMCDFLFHFKSAFVIELD